MSEGQVLLSAQGPIATITFDRPAARNAMTWPMYEQLKQHCLTLGCPSPTWPGCGPRGDWTA